METLIQFIILFIIFFIAGGILILCGWLIWKKEKISLIHDYHYTKVSEESKKPYTEGIGKACIIMGIGMIVSGIVGIITSSYYCWIIFILTFVWGCIKMIKVQQKFNKGLF